MKHREENATLKGLYLASLLVLGAVLAVVIVVLRERSVDKRRNSEAASFGMRNAKGEISLDAVGQQLEELIKLYRRGESKAFPFLALGATNISVMSVKQSRNTNMATADVLVIADGNRHHLEVPLSVVPLTFIETLPAPPSEVEIRQHLDQQINQLLKGEKSELRLPKHGWTNIVVESLTIPTNYASRYPYRADAILLSQGLNATGGEPVQFRSGLSIVCMDEDDWKFWYKPVPQ